MAVLNLVKPVANAQTVLPIDEQITDYVFDFDISEAVLEKIDGNLVITFDADGSMITLEGFYEVYNAEFIPNFVLDGEMVSGEDFFNAMDPNLMPAAGPGEGVNDDGSSFNQANMHNVDTGVNALGGKDGGSAYNADPTLLVGGGTVGVDEFGNLIPDAPNIAPTLSFNNLGVKADVAKLTTYDDEDFTSGKDVDNDGSAHTTTGSFTFTPGNGFTDVTINGESIFDENGELDTDKEFKNFDKNGEYVGTLKVESYDVETGEVIYSYTQNGSQEHEEGSDSLTEEFKVEVKDLDGDIVTGTITIEIIDDKPIAYGDTKEISKTEVGAEGNILANDDLSADGTTISNVALPKEGMEDWVQGSDSFGDEGFVTFTHPSKGSITINKDGSYTFTYTDKSLSDGEFENFTFDYTITDSDGDSSSSTLTLKVNGTNDIPEITNPSQTVTVTEAGVGDGNPDADAANPNLDFTGKAVVEGKVSGKDVDGDTLSFSVSGKPDSSLGTFEIDPKTGDYTFTIDNKNSDVNALEEGQKITETYEIEVSDGKGGTTTTTVTVEIVGTNDMPTLSLDKASLEIGEDATTVLTGKATSTDVDVNDTTNFGVGLKVDGETEPVLSNSVEGKYGTLTIDENGNYSYTLDNSKAQHLGQKESETESFTVYVQDKNGAWVEQDLSIKVNGADDKATISVEDLSTSDAGIGSDAGQDSGSFTFKDVDGMENGEILIQLGTAEVTIKFDKDGNPIFSDATVEGKYGDLTITDIKPTTGGGFTVDYTYVQDKAKDHTDTESTTESTLSEEFRVTIKDAHGGESIENIEVTITDDGPSITSVQNPTYSLYEKHLQGGTEQNASTSGITTGTINFDFGADSAEGTFAWNIDEAPNLITSDDNKEVIWSYDNGDTTKLVGKDTEGNEVIRMEMDVTAGKYTTTLTQAVEHYAPEGSDKNSDGANMDRNQDVVTDTNDIGTTGNENKWSTAADSDAPTGLDFGFTITDGDGDSVSSEVTITVQDDTIHLENNGPATVTATSVEDAYFTKDFNFVPTVDTKNTDLDDPNNYGGMKISSGRLDYNVADGEVPTLGGSTQDVHYQGTGYKSGQGIGIPGAEGWRETGYNPDNNTSEALVLDLPEGEIASGATLTLSAFFPDFASSSNYSEKALIQLYLDGEYQGSVEVEAQNADGTLVVKTPEGMEFDRLVIAGMDNGSEYVKNNTETTSDDMFGASDFLLKDIQFEYPILSTASGDVNFKGADGFDSAEGFSLNSIAGQSLEGIDATPEGNPTIELGDKTLTLTMVDNVYYATGSDGIYFTVTVDAATGEWTMNQLKPFGDEVKLEIGAKDNDGDSASVDITVKGDAAPKALADTDSVAEGASITGDVIEGTVTDGEGKADTAGDGTSELIAVKAPEGWTQVGDNPLAWKSDAGTITFDKDGNYTFESESNSVNSDTSFEFGYTIKDSDGDTSSSSLTITVENAQAPSLPDHKFVVDETGLNTEKDTSEIDSATKAEWLGENNTAKAGTYNVYDYNNSVIATAKVDANGNVEVELIESTTHGDSSNTNESSYGRVIVDVVDANGNTHKTTFDVEIKDDAPTTHNDVVINNIDTATDVATTIIDIDFGADNDEGKIIEFNDTTFVYTHDNGWEVQDGGYGSVYVTEEGIVSLESGNMTLSQSLDSEGDSWIAEVQNASKLGSEVIDVTLRDSDGDTQEFNVSVGTDSTGEVVALDSLASHLVEGTAYNLAFILDISGSMYSDSYNGVVKDASPGADGVLEDPVTRLSEACDAMREFVNTTLENHAELADSTGGVVNLYMGTFYGKTGYETFTLDPSKGEGTPEENLAAQVKEINDHIDSIERLQYDTAIKFPTAEELADGKITIHGVEYDAVLSEDGNTVVINNITYQKIEVTEGVGEGEYLGHTTSHTSVDEHAGTIAYSLLENGSGYSPNFHWQTNYEGAFTDAASWYETVGQNGNENEIFFMSDGTPSTGADGRTEVNKGFDKLEAALGEAGGSIHAIGIGKGANENLLDQFDNTINSDGQNAETVTDGNISDMFAPDQGAGQNSAIKLSVAFTQGDGANNDVMLGGISKEALVEALQAKLPGMTITDALLVDYMQNNPDWARTEVGFSADKVNKDALIGEQGEDLLYGMHGNDLLVGDGDKDILQDLAAGLKMENADEYSHENLIVDKDDNPETDDSKALISDLVDQALENPQELVDIFNAMESVEDGSDTLYGGTGDDILAGLGGSDFIYGEDGDDIIFAGSGDDTIYAGSGDDIIFAGAGNDNIYLGEGNDTVYVDVSDFVEGEESNDIIHDFDKGSDMLDLTSLKLDKESLKLDKDGDNGIIKFEVDGAEQTITLVGLGDEVANLDLDSGESFIKI